jgi:hypothetical protein
MALILPTFRRRCLRWQWSGGRLDFSRLLGVLIVWTLPTRVVFVSSSLEEMTRGEETQQDYNG